MRGGQLSEGDVDGGHRVIRVEPDFETAPTSHDALQVFIQRGAGILHRVAPLVPALHGTAGDPEAAEIVRSSDERRVASYREVVNVVASKPDGLRRALSKNAATDILIVLFSAEAYQGLLTRGWSHRRCTTFFADLLASQLLTPSPAHGTEVRY